MALDPGDLTVDSFPTSEAAIEPGGGYCCTGCASGCGYIPTGLGCESGGSGDVFCPQTITAAE
jgi:hypothetical protein